VIPLPFVLAQTLLVLMSGSLGSQSTVPGDFALRLEFGICTTDVIDTFKGTYVRDLGTGRKVSTHVTVSKALNAELHDLVTQAAFFDYPLVFRPHGNGGHEPYDFYRLKVRDAGVTQSVTWDDVMDSTLPEAERFRDLVRHVIRVFREMPAVKALPQQRIGCL
jgi:hypothetical protein